MYASVFQACLSKRPFNLFHRANLYIRTAKVERSFGNKTTWEHPFPLLVKRFVEEYNRAVFSNGRNNKVIGGFNALAAPNGVDLVYIDPPYYSRSSDKGTNYLTYYHFLERIAKYNEWDALINDCFGKIKRLSDNEDIFNFSRKTEITESLKKVIKMFASNKIVLSYQDDGISSEIEIVAILRQIGKRIK